MYARCTSYRADRAKRAARPGQGVFGLRLLGLASSCAHMDLELDRCGLLGLVRETDCDAVDRAVEGEIARTPVDSA